MAYPPRLLSEDENVIREFRPHWSAIAIPTALAIGFTIVGGVIGAVLTQGWLPLIIGLIIGLGFALPKLAVWAFTKYVITNERVIVRSGVFARQGKEIPLEVINDVAFSQSLIERMFGSGDLLLESAGEMGQSRFTNVPTPEDIQTVIYRAREDRMATLNSGQTPADVLTTLAQLHREGVLTDEEFAAKKHKLLGDI